MTLTTQTNFISAFICFFVLVLFVDDKQSTSCPSLSLFNQQNYYWTGVLTFTSPGIAQVCQPFNSQLTPSSYQSVFPVHTERKLSYQDSRVAGPGKGGKAESGGMLWKVAESSGMHHSASPPSPENGECHLFL